MLARISKTNLFHRSFSHWPLLVIVSYIYVSATLYVTSGKALKGLRNRNSTLAGSDLELKPGIFVISLLTYSLFLILYLWINRIRTNHFAHTNASIKAFRVGLLALPSLVSVLSLLGIDKIAPFLYQTLRVSYLRPIFADLRTVLIAISCDDVSTMGNLITCDYRTSNNSYIYPSVLLSLRRLHFTESLTLPIALTYSILFIVLILKLLERLDNNLISYVMFASPTFLLLFDRLNLDLIIIVHLLIAIYLLRKSYFYWALVLSISTVFLKFYTLPIVLLFIVLAKTRVQQVITAIALVFTAFVLRHDLTQVLNSVGNDINGSYGLKVFLSHLSGAERASFPQDAVIWIHFFFLFLTISLIIYVTSYRIIYQSMKNSQILWLISLFFPLLFLATWLTSSNYPYRLSLLCVTAIIFSQISLPGSLSNFFLATTFFVQFLSLATTGFLQNLLLIPLVVMCLLLSTAATQLALRRIRKTNR